MANTRAMDRHTEITVEELQAVIVVLDKGGRSCFGFNCSMSVAGLFGIASLLAFADAIRRFFTCDGEPDICSHAEVPEIILGTFGLILSLIAAVTACNEDPLGPRLTALTRDDFAEVSRIGNGVGLKILSTDPVSVVVDLLKSKLHDKLQPTYSTFRELTIFPPRDNAEDATDKFEIVIHLAVDP